VARKRRDWESGWILSVVIRAHEGRAIFATDEDRAFFVERLREIFVAPDVELLAWAVLLNHVHLVIRVGEVAPAALFRRLDTVVAMRERRRRGDHGAVLQDRYWSRPCHGEGEALRLLTYVLGNPAHHGAVETAEALETYPWTAYPEVLGRSRPGIVDPARTLALIHPDADVARQTLREAMEARVARWHAERDGVDVCDEPGCRGSPDGCGLVHRRRAASAPSALDGISEAVGTGGVPIEHDELRDRRTRLRASGWRPEELVASVCARLEVDPAAVRSGSRLHAESRARAVIAHVACDVAGVSAVDAARLLGVGAAALTAARRRGRVLVVSKGWSVDDVLSWGGPAT
jgi:putative transposase